MGIKNNLNINLMLEFYYLLLGGFNTICGAIISHCDKNTSWTDNLRHSPVIQDLFSTLITSTGKKAIEKDRIRTDYDGVILENFAPFGT